MRKIFLLFLAALLALQPFTPVWAEAILDSEDSTAVTDATETIAAANPTEATETVETAVPAEASESAETAAPTETSEAAEAMESAEATEAAGAAEHAETAESINAPMTVSPTEAEIETQPVRVRFICDSENLALVVYPAEGDIDQAIDPEEDGTYLLLPGDYGYLAAVDDCAPVEGRFSVTNGEAAVEITLSPKDTKEAVDTLASNAVASGVCGENLTWALTRNGTLTISGSGNMEDYSYSSPKAPWYSMRKDIRSVEIEKGVMSIGNYAFDGCEKLASVAIPLGITDIGKWAFSNCKSLISVAIPGSVSCIGDLAFFGCYGLTNVTIAEGVTSIGQEAFSSCGLTSVTIPGSVTSIGVGAFYNAKLASVTISRGVTSIGEGAFCGTYLTSITIPEGVTSIAANTFYGCKSLTSVIIPESVTSIGDSAFQFCEGLASITIPEGVASIGHSAFAVCHGLTSVTIPGNVTSIGEEAFFECNNLKNVTILEGVTDIDDFAFSWCAALTSVTIPKSMTSIRDGAFYACDALKHMYYGDSDTQWKRIEIGENNAPLTSAEIHCTKHIHTLRYTASSAADCVRPGNKAYYTCESCGKVYADEAGTEETTPEAETLPALGHSMVKTEASAPTYFTNGNQEYYSCSRCGRVFKDEQGQTETTIAEESLPMLPSVAHGTCGAQGDNLIWVLTEDGVLTISGEGNMNDYTHEETAPWNTHQLQITAVMLKSGVTTIGNSAFEGCLSLASVTISEGVTSIGERAFNGCLSLTSVTISGSVASIGSSAFSDCNGLTAIVLPDRLSDIGTWAFARCYQLTAIIVPSGVASIGDYAFSDCCALKSIAFRGEAPAIGDNAFYSVTANASYPQSNSTWSDSVRQNYGGKITWATNGMSLPLPVMTSVESGKSGVTVKWNAVPGAEKYRVFYKASGGSWKIVGDTTATSYTVTGLQSGTRYTFTVRCVSADGKNYTSDYDRTGKSITYIAQPTVRALESVSGGVMVKWNGVSGAEKYRVYYKTAGGSWKGAGDTTGTSLTVKGLTGGTRYTFTLRCVSADGKNYTSDYDRTGKSITYIAQPAISALENTTNGVMVKWNAVSGAEKYRVYYKTASTSWKSGGDTTGTSQTVTGLQSGTEYTFTVRCVTADGKGYASGYDTAGKRIVYTPKAASTLANPIISGLENVSNGVKVKWGAVSGAEKYRVFCKTAGTGWKIVGDTTATSYTVTGLQSGTRYTFTIRCISADAKRYTSEYDRTGKSITYLSQPAVSSAENTAGGVLVKWNAVPGAAKYRVFYKTAGSSWKVAGDTTGTSYTVTGLTSGTAYTFTVRCVSADGKGFTSSYDAKGVTLTVK